MERNNNQKMPINVANIRISLSKDENTEIKNNRKLFEPQS